MKRDIVSPSLLRAAQGDAGALQLCATRLLEAWALLQSARIEAGCRGDDRAAAVLTWIDSALTLPDRD